MKKFVNINFEILKGCHLKCEGCFVNKQGASPLTEVDQATIDQILQGFKKLSYIPFIAFIGPTDFLISDNTAEILGNKNLQNLFKHFKKISLQTTFLDMRKAEKMAEILRKDFNEIALEVNIVLEPNKLQNEKYLETIYQNKVLFNTLLEREDIQNYGVMNIFDYNQLNHKDYNSYLKMHEVAEKIIQTGIDFNLSLSRATFLDQKTYQSYANSIRSLHEKVELTNKESAPQIDKELQFIFSSGSLYYSPLFYERVGIFNSSFKIPAEYYTAAGLLQYQKEMEHRQQQKVSKMKECADCSFHDLCIERGILELMDYVNDPHCYMPKKNPHFIYQMGTLPL